MKSIVVSIALVAVFFAGCPEKKTEPVPVGEMSEYKDPGYGFKIKYPMDWKQLGTTGKAVFAKSQEIIDKFQNPASGIEGAMVTAEVVRYDGKTAADLIAANKEELKQSETLTLGPDEQTTVAGKPATKVPYSIKVTSKTNITGFEIFIPGDTALYKLHLVGFGEQFGAHAAVFDAMVKSYELPVIVLKKPDVWAPSPNEDTYKSAFFTMSYPENLEMVDVKKGNNDFAMEMRADRRDCSIHIDVFGAKGLTVEKVWEQNKSRYKAKAKGNSTIDGNQAFWVDYSPVSNINSRAYFVVKNDKVIRGTLNWFAPQKDVYFPAFEKCINSLKIN
ncbi:MAG TPA: PsbP-related protein [Bacteroidota bacterium]|jgi:hypothetical protein|nr:PsbP-related protein [Bacteroidota bacterium]